MAFPRLAIKAFSPLPFPRHFLLPTISHAQTRFTQPPRIHTKNSHYHSHKRNFHLDFRSRYSTDMKLLSLIGWSLLKSWHTMMSLPRQSPPSWYNDRYREELIEYSESTSYLERLSEESDVFYILSRSRYDGYPLAPLPPLLSFDRTLTRSARNALVYAYMIGKYTSRLMFYRAVARKCGYRDWWGVREVINPGKTVKLEQVARRHGIEEERFKEAAGKLLRYWPILP